MDSRSTTVGSLIHGYNTQLVDNVRVTGTTKLFRMDNKDKSLFYVRAVKWTLKQQSTYYDADQTCWWLETKTSKNWGRSFLQTTHIQCFPFWRKESLDGNRMKPWYWTWNNSLKNQPPHQPGAIEVYDPGMGGLLSRKGSYLSVKCWQYIATLETTAGGAVDYWFAALQLIWVHPIAIHCCQVWYII